MICLRLFWSNNDIIIIIGYRDLLILSLNKRIKKKLLNLTHINLIILWTNRKIHHLFSNRIDWHRQSTEKRLRINLRNDYESYQYNTSGEIIHFYIATTTEWRWFRAVVGEIMNLKRKKKFHPQKIVAKVLFFFRMTLIVFIEIFML